jgi:hypothetical protein
MGDELGENTTSSLDTKCKRANIDEDNIFGSNFAGENTTLDSSTVSNGLIQVDTLHILSGESNTRLENSNLFTCHASNHLCSYPRPKPMSNNPSLDLDHHVPLIGSCSLVAHYVPQHILQSVGSIYNLEGCHIAGCTLKDVLFDIQLWSLFSVQVFQSLSQVKVNLFSE